MKKKQLFKTDYRLVTGYIIAFVLLLFSYLITLFSNRELIRHTQSLNLTHNVISDVENLLSQIKDVETGYRGYIITKDSSFLAPNQKAILTTGSIFSKLEKEVKDNKNLQLHLGEMKLLIDRKFFIIKNNINYYNLHNKTFDSFLLDKSYIGKDVMDSIRLLANNIQANEKNILITRSKKVDNEYTALNSIVVASLLLALIFAAFGVVTFIKEKKARQESDNKVVLFQKELTQRIEELDRANKELIEMRREEKFASTGRIARIIAHEVRNPLTNIDLAISLIKKDVNKENEELDFLFEMITRNSNRINQLITELLNATRLTDLVFIKTSISSILNEVIELARDRTELDSINVQKKFSLVSDDVMVDVEKLKIAFLNIIINAIEAMSGKDNRTLQLITNSKNGKCVIEISDTGAGMDEKELSKLFEAYYTTKPKGNGLGLTNTQNIILNHKGSIEVKSKPGVGSRFIITLDSIPQV